MSKKERKKINVKIIYKKKEEKRKRTKKEQSTFNALQCTAENIPAVVQKYQTKQKLNKNKMEKSICWRYPAADTHKNNMDMQRRHRDDTSFLEWLLWK